MSNDPGAKIACWLCGTDSHDEDISSCEGCTASTCETHLRKCITCGKELCVKCGQWRANWDEHVPGKRGYDIVRTGICRDCDESSPEEPPIEANEPLDWREVAWAVAALATVAAWAWLMWLAWRVM